MTTTLAKETTPSPPSPYRFSREAVMAQGNKIRLSDSDPDNGLDLYCYNRCSNDDPRIVRECRGVVFNNERIVLKTFPFAIIALIPSLIWYSPPFLMLLSKTC